MMAIPASFSSQWDARFTFSSRSGSIIQLSRSLALAIRGQWGHAFIYFALAIVTLGIAAPILWFVYGGIANKLLAQKLMMENGLVFDSDNDTNTVRQASMRWGVKVPNEFSVKASEG